MGNTFNTNLRWVGYQVQNNILFGEPAVFIYAQEGKWGMLIQDTFTRPADVYFKDRCRNTALHIACRMQPPIDAIQALVRAYPGAAFIKTVDGMTPLHFACYCGASVDVVRLLIGIGAENVKKLDKRGRSPLHCSCAGFRTKDKHEILRILLEVDPEMASREDNMGRTPLSLMLDDYVEEIEEITCMNGNHSFSSNSISHSHRSTNANPRAEIISEELEDCLKCTTILLRAAYHGSVSDLILTREPFRLLHASVGTSCCPPHFIRLALKIKPNQISEPDLNGNLPLHIAAQTSVSSHSTRIDIRFNIIESILTLYPMAARISNNNGSLPLALAIENRKTWNDGVRAILEAHPAALSTIQIDINIYHYILERIARGSSPTVLFEVIKAKPEIVPTPLVSSKYSILSEFQDWSQ